MQRPEPTTLTAQEQATLLLAGHQARRHERETAVQPFRRVRNQ